MCSQDLEHLGDQIGKSISAASYALWVFTNGILCTLYVSVVFDTDGKSFREKNSK